MQLAGLSLQDRDDPSAVVARFAGDDRFIVDYLADEVLARQSDDVRDFLLSTSILERLSGPLCDAVTGRAGGGARLVEPGTRRAFPRAARRPPAVVAVSPPFRRRAARAPRRASSPDRGAELHRRAAAWLAVNGDVAEAVGTPWRAATSLTPRTSWNCR